MQSISKNDFFGLLFGVQEGPEYVLRLTSKEEVWAAKRKTILKMIIEVIFAGNEV